MGCQILIQRRFLLTCCTLPDPRTLRAAFMCGREPNFELSEEEKQELKQLNWDKFLAMTRSAITNKSKKLPPFKIQLFGLT